MIVFLPFISNTVSDEGLMKMEMNKFILSIVASAP